MSSLRTMFVTKAFIPCLIKLSLCICGLSRSIFLTHIVNLGLSKMKEWLKTNYFKHSVKKYATHLRVNIINLY